MSKSIVVVQPDELEPNDHGERALANKSNGSDRIEFIHATIPDEVDAKDVVYDGQDELVYIIQGKCEIIFDGKTEIVGPGGFFFVPAGASYDFKVLEGPAEAVAAFSPQRA